MSWFRKRRRFSVECVECPGGWTAEIRDSDGRLMSIGEGNTPAAAAHDASSPEKGAQSELEAAQALFVAGDIDEAELERRVEDAL